MKRYGHVIFEKGGREGAEQQKAIIMAIRAAGIIQITDERINEWYQKDCLSKTGGVHHYVLHNREETDLFRTILERESLSHPDIHWEISVFRKSLEFSEWLKKKEKAKKKIKLKEYRDKRKRESKDGKREKV